MVARPTLHKVPYRPSKTKCLNTLEAATAIKMEAMKMTMVDTEAANQAWTIKIHLSQIPSEHLGRMLKVNYS
jgi:hypothetical protein